MGAAPGQRSWLSETFSLFSILIFMALKNSKTGSLPVSEIYNFMTEHFPYFKVSPWSSCTLPPLWELGQALPLCSQMVEPRTSGS